MLTNRPKGKKRLNYKAWWHWTINNLELLLDPGYKLLSEKGQQKSLVKLLIEAKERFYRGDSTGSIDLAHLTNLVDDLNFLHNMNPTLFSKYKKILVSGRAKDFGFLTGHWFEVRIACMLIKSRFQFSQPDPPDFNVLINDVNVGVECHAPRVEIGGNIQQRVINAIKKKESKYKGQPWFSELKILILDATWLIRANGSETIQSQNPLSIDLESGLIEAARSKSYNLIIAFWFGHTIINNKNLRAESCVFIPTDNQEPEVVIFRNRFLENFKILDCETIVLPSLPKKMNNSQ